MRFHPTNTTENVPEVEPATVEQILDAYAKRNLDALLTVLARRPHEFARQLNRIHRAFPADIERIAATLTEVGRKLPLQTLVRLHNQYANATRGVGEKISLDNSQMVHLTQIPAMTRRYAARLLLAVEMCLVYRMRRLTVTMPTEDFYRPMEAEPAPISCNPALDGTLNPFVPAPWEHFTLNSSEGAADMLCASGVREVPDGYELSVVLLDEDYSRVSTVERGEPETSFSCFWDEEAEDAENDLRCGMGLGYRIEEYAEIDVRGAMNWGARYVVVTARVGERFPAGPVPVNATEQPEHPVPDQQPRFHSQVAPDLRALTVTGRGGMRPMTHRGNFHVLDAPGRSVCAVLDLYKQRLVTPAVGIPAGTDEDAALVAIMGALNGYLPMTVREFLKLTGVQVKVTG